MAHLPGFWSKLIGFMASSRGCFTISGTATSSCSAVGERWNIFGCCFASYLVLTRYMDAHMLILARIYVIL